LDLVTTGAVEEPPRLWTEQWAIQSAVKADTIEHQMRVATATGPVDARQQAVVCAIEDLIATAREAVRRPPRTQRWWQRRPWVYRGPRDWWRGTSVERAHQSLHAAEIFLVELLSEAQVEALIPKVVARADTVLQRDDPRRLPIDELPLMPPGPGRTAALQRGMDIAYDATDQLHVRVRDFRNVLLVSAFLISLLMGLLVWIVATHPSAMPMCFSPSATAPSNTVTGDGTPGQEVQACPSGDRRLPAGGDVLIVAGLGLLGGALAGAFAIRKIRGTSTPYDIPIALALLKVPSGSLTAVAGILLLGGGFVPGLSELDSQRQILAYALVFGYAQQLGTRFIDDRAQALLDSVPSKDPEAKQPEPSLVSPLPPPPRPASIEETSGLTLDQTTGPPGSVTTNP
jgi:hypothetical protein